MTASRMIGVKPESEDTLAAIATFERGRDPALLARKYAAMRQSPFAFMRGTCHLFYATLASAPEFSSASMLDGAPRTWLSGDLHVENFGTYKGDNRLTYFDITDFDESALGPVILDIARLLSSILAGGSEWGLNADDALALARKAQVAYATELASGKASWIERENARGVLKRLFAQVAGRSRTELLDRFTVRKAKHRRLVIDDKHALSIPEEQRTNVERMIAAVGVAARDEAYFAPIDVAQRVSGIGSLGTPRFIALVEGRGSPDRNVLLTIKAARRSSLAQMPRLVAGVQPEWPSEAARIANVQRHCSAVPPAFLRTLEWNSDSYVVRELQPEDDRVRLRDWEKHPKKLGDAIITMAAVSAWMHLRGAAWRGSASVDELVSFAHDDQWAPVLMRCSQDASTRTEHQFQQFARAYDNRELDASADGTTDRITGGATTTTTTMPPSP
ncbi:MAG: DUF2252 domain-containing protein [Gemmatimonadaceae bacterium]